MSVTKSSHAFRWPSASADSLARAGRAVEERLAALPLGGYLLLIVVAIGLLLLLAGDFGESWDLVFAEMRGRATYDFYFDGFNGDRFNAVIPLSSRYYGPLSDLLITIAQQGTNDGVERLEIRTVLQAMISLSCLIPIFLIATRVVSKPLALVAVILVAATPAFFGHAFINPKDSVFASTFLWALYLILVCFEDGRRPGYVALVGLGTLLGVVTSIRYIGGYLLLLVPLAAIVLPTLRVEGGGVLDAMRSNALRHVGAFVILCLTLAATYVAVMPSLLADLQTQTFLDIFSKFANYPWTGKVLYFGEYYSAHELPWHYLYGYMLVQLPLYYHLFLLIVLAAFVVAPRVTVASFRGFLKRDDRAASTVVILTAALIIPILLILVMRPSLYDAFRHVLFLVPILCLLLYIAFLGVLAILPRIASVAICVIAVLCLGEAVGAAMRLHPYEYTYYNPLVKPQGKFELDYWGTSFREVAQRLNDYARDHEGEKLALSVCGPPRALTPYLDAERFEIVPMESTSTRLIVALNRLGCSSFITPTPLIAIRRGGALFVGVERAVLLN